MGKRTGITKTFIIIATVEVGEKGSFASMFLKEPRGGLPPNFKLVDVIPLDNPMIISPKGFKGLEIIPITGETVIHGRHIQRRIKPR